MDGLVKLAWTKKRLATAHKVYNDLSNKLKDTDVIDDKELEHFSDYLKRKDMDVTIAVTDDFDPDVAAAFAPKRDAERKRKKLNRRRSKPQEDAEYFLKNYNGRIGKDGFVISDMSRSTLSHELGHAIDYKDRPLLKRLISGASASPAANSTVLGLTGMYAGFNNAGNDEDYLKGLAESSSITGTIAGGAAIGNGSLQIASENRANRNAYKILSEMHDKETADRLIRDATPLREAALNTYREGRLYNTKNNAIGGLIGGGIGYSAGVKLKELLNKKEGQDSYR